MNDFIEAIKSGNMVECKKAFNAIMESRVKGIREDIRVQLAENIRGEGENDPSQEEEEENDGADEDEPEKKPKDPKDKE